MLSTIANVLCHSTSSILLTDCLQTSKVLCLDVVDLLDRQGLVDISLLSFTSNSRSRNLGNLALRSLGSLSSLRSTSASTSDRTNTSSQTLTIVIDVIRLSTRSIDRSTRPILSCSNDQRQNLIHRESSVVVHNSNDRLSLIHSSHNIFPFRLERGNPSLSSAYRVVYYI